MVLHEVLVDPLPTAVVLPEREEVFHDALVLLPVVAVLPEREEIFHDALVMGEEERAMLEIPEVEVCLPVGVLEATLQVEAVTKERVVVLAEKV